MKKIIFMIFWYLSSLEYIFVANAENIKDSIIPDSGNNIVINNDKQWQNLLFSIFEYIKESIFWLLALVAITVFIFIWARLVMARWNPEEFKKALMNFVYAIVWLAIVAISWAAVKLVSSLNF